MKRPALKWELYGMLFGVLLGSFLHFAYELSGEWIPVGVFGAVNESVWEHLKLGFWPMVIWAAIEYPYLKKQTSNFLTAKAAGIYVIPATILVLFYAYTAILGEEMLVLDILIFVLAIVLGQLTSYRLLTLPRLPKVMDGVALAAVILLFLAYTLFTFFPPHLPIFQDPISGNYGI